MIKDSSEPSCGRDSSELGCGRVSTVVTSSLMDYVHNVWSDGEIYDDVELKQYREVLDSKICDLVSLIKELHFTCKANYVARLEVLCIFLRDVLGLEVDHECLENIDGMSPLNTALAHNSCEAATLLLQHGGKEVILRQIRADSCAHVTSLHLAVVTGQLSVVKLIVEMLGEKEKHQVVNQHATGELFNKTLKASTLPLTLALWSGHEDIFNCLIRYGAELDAGDCVTGNTILHSLVEYGEYCSDHAWSMMELILYGESTHIWWCRKRNIDLKKCGILEISKMRMYLLKQENKKGYTPLTLAARIGVAKIMVNLLQTEDVYKLTCWNYGPCSYSLYDMTEIDPIATSAGRPSILDLIIHDTPDDQLWSLSQQPFKELITKKWNSYSVMFIVWGVFHTTMMAFFTALAMDQKYMGIQKKEYSQTLFQTIIEVICFLTGVVYLLGEFYEIGKKVKMYIDSRYHVSRTGFYRVPWTVLLGFDTFRFVLFLFSTLIVVWFTLRLEFNNSTNVVMAVCLVSGWYFVLYFTRAFRPLGFFAVMMDRIIFGDLMRFSFVIGIFLLGFGSALRVVYEDAVTDIPEEMSGLGHAILTMFRIMVGLESFTIIDQTRDHIAAALFFVAFVLLATIQLINMLIASMSDTYASVSKHRECIWRKLSLGALLLLERRVPPFLRTMMTKRYLVKSQRTGQWLLPVKEIHKWKETK